MTLGRRTLLAAALALLPTRSLAAMPPLNVLELRQYTLHGGRRNELAALFHRAFVAPQEAVGAHVLGTFRDLDDPDRFVWLRGFPDMEARRQALEAFYFGPVWKAHREAANATILDSDNVLLLKPAGTAAGFDGKAPAAGVLRVAIHSLRNADPAAFTHFFDQALAPRIAADGAKVLARYVTEPSPNTFSRLPVREGEPVFVWFAAFADERAERRFSARLATESGWRDGVDEALLPALMRKPEVLRLARL